MPKVSIIIPLHNAEDYISETLESCFNQTYKDIEVIVVENGSSDRGYALVKNLNDKRLQLFKIETPNAAAARNFGLSKAIGDYIMFLDADDVISDNKLEMQLNALIQKPNGYLSSCAWAKFDKETADSRIEPQPVWNIEDPIQWCMKSWKGGGMMIPGCWLIPKNIIDKSGDWDERLSLHDDGEFMCRVLLASKGNVFVDDTIVYYRQVSNSLSKQNKSLKAANSALEVCKSYEKNTRLINDSLEVRIALAYNYSRFIYEFYPHHMEFIEQAQTHIKTLGVTPPIVGGHQFRKLAKCIGFYNAISFRELARKIKGQ